MATSYPFHDQQMGPEIREKLNELYATWEAAIGNIVKGDNGWSPLIRPVADGNRQVLQLYDWAGGEGAKPTVTGFLGPLGFVATAAQATDMRGIQGLPGNPGPANVLSVGSVSTGAPGSAAAASITGTAPNQTLNLAIPRGSPGDTGATPNIQVGTTTTSAPGTNAQVSITGTANSPIVNFTIPRGQDGAGTGDMSKSVYDPTSSGSVVKADRWAAPVVINGVTIDGTQGTVTLPPSGGDLTTQLRPKSYGLLAAGTLQSSLQVEAAATGAAYQVFHRPGSFAAGFGLDVDNKWKVGGWSYGNVAYALYHEGNKPTSADVGLGNANNTSDVNKPVSTAQQAAIDLKALDNHQNILPNGGFQLGLDGWTFSHQFAASTSPYWGAVAMVTGLSGSMVCVGSSPIIPCAGSTQYTVSADSLLLGTGVTGSTYFDFQILDAAGAVIQDSGETAITGTHDFSDSPGRRSEHKFTVTTLANAANMRVRFVGTTTAGTGIIMGCRRVKVERGTTVTPWSDEATLSRIQDQLNGKLEDSSLGVVTQNSQAANYTLVAADVGKHILHPAGDGTARTYTIPANSAVAFPIGSAVTFVNQNGGGVITIAITTDTMRLAGAGTTGSRTLAANGVATALKIAATEWVISGSGLT